MAGKSRVVSLVKGPDGLGIAVTTAVVGEVKWPRVSSVRAGSAAERCGIVHVGDFIAEANGFCVAGKTHLFVRELLQLAPDDSRVTLKLLGPGRQCALGSGVASSCVSQVLECLHAVCPVR